MVSMTFVPPHDDVQRRMHLPSIPDFYKSSGSVILPNPWPVITICGSTRFQWHAALAETFLTHMGWLVYAFGGIEKGTAACFYDKETMEHGLASAEHKRMMEDMWRHKIDRSDAIYVINEGGYIGESVQDEIDYARSRGKLIYYMEPPEENKHE